MKNYHRRNGRGVHVRKPHVRKNIVNVTTWECLASPAVDVRNVLTNEE